MSRDIFGGVGLSKKVEFHPQFQIKYTLSTNQEFQTKNISIVYNYFRNAFLVIRDDELNSLTLLGQKKTLEHS